jgi:serine/threonine protein kinase
VEDGTDLYEHLRNKKKDVHEIIEMMKQATEGLKYLHSKDVVHGYIHPRNILVEKNQARLANFKLQDRFEDFELFEVNKLAFLY